MTIEMAYGEIERQKDAAEAIGEDRYRTLAAELLGNPITVTDADRDAAAKSAGDEFARLGRITRLGGEFSADHVAAHPASYGVDEDQFARRCCAAAVSRWLASRGVEPTIYARSKFMIQIERLTPHFVGDRSRILALVAT